MSSYFSKLYIFSINWSCGKVKALIWFAGRLFVALWKCQIKNCPIGPVVKIASIAQGTGSIPDWGSKIPYYFQCGQKKKKAKWEEKIAKKTYVLGSRLWGATVMEGEIQIFRFGTLLQTSSTFKNTFLKDINKNSVLLCLPKKIFSLNSGNYFNNHNI